jgi:putative Holliday junction resolvase
MGILLGIDLGERRVGVAVSDPDGLVATPLGLLDGSDEKKLAGEIARLVRETGAGEVVLGLPRNMDGTIGERAEAALRFRRLLEGEVSVPVQMWDERLTSAEAERVIRAGEERVGPKGERRPRRRSASRRREEKGTIDRIAAVLILQAFLDRRNREEGRE